MDATTSDSADPGQPEREGSVRPRHGLRSTIFWLLYRASVAAQAVTQQRLVDAGMRRGFHGTLATLHHHGPSTQVQVGEAIGIHPSDMGPIITDLEAQGWVERHRSTQDKRSYTITITPAGITTLQRFDTAIEQAEHAVLDCLDPTEQHALAGYLERIIATTDHHHPTDPDQLPGDIWRTFPRRDNR